MDNSAENYVNDPTIEAAFAFHAFEHCQMHMSLLCAVNPADIKLSTCDDFIYETFRSAFPSLNVDVLDEDSLKSAEAKQAWRGLIEKFTGLENYNFGTLLRLRCSGEYYSSNTTLVTRIQWIAIEIARNREGLNDVVRNSFNPEKLYRESCDS